MTRRQLLRAGGAVLAAGGAGISACAAPPAGKPTLCFFSKHLAELDYARLARALKELGFPGVDLTVRPQGHVLPERAAEDLPRAVGILRDAGLVVPMITTGLLTAADPAARPTLSAAGKLGIPFFKPGYYRYTKMAAANAVKNALEDTRKRFATLVELAREFRVQAGFHNHSGTYVGAAMWDAYEVLRDQDPQWAGFYFDPGHAVTEGGAAGWTIGLNLLAPRIKMIAAKDFYWEKKDGKWQQRWCPLGEGMVPWSDVFKQLAAAGFSGPVSLHLEYDLPADPLPAMARDLAFLQARVREAYT